jgi:hypothetical protein
VKDVVLSFLSFLPFAEHFSQFFINQEKNRSLFIFKKKIVSKKGAVDGGKVVSHVVGPSVVSLRLGPRWWLSPILGQGGWCWLAALVRR